MAVDRFAAMNRDWWAGEGEGFIYNEFADALREGFDLGVLTRADLRGDDAHVISCLHSARSPLIESKLDRIAPFQARIPRRLHRPRRAQGPLARPAGRAWGGVSKSL